MTRSREYLFIEAFNTYLYSLSDDLMIGSFKEPLSVWELKNQTEHKRKSLQKYILRIPFRHGREEPLLEQDVPDIDYLCIHLNAYFEKYYLTLPNGIILSRVYVFNGVITPNELLVDINVQYYQSHQPYYVKPTPYESLVELNQQLIVETRKELNRQKQIYDNNYARMADKIRKLYGENEEKTDCPVCYEGITEDTLFVSGCCHFICNQCVTKCSKCPICRDDYELIVYN